VTEQSAQQIQPKATQENNITEREQEAATKIQALQRGNMGRRKAAKANLDALLAEDAKENEAATKIQTAFRGSRQKVEVKGQVPKIDEQYVDKIAQDNAMQRTSAVEGETRAAALGALAETLTTPTTQANPEVDQKPQTPIQVLDQKLEKVLGAVEVLTNSVANLAEKTQKLEEKVSPSIPVDLKEAEKQQAIEAQKADGQKVTEARSVAKAQIEQIQDAALKSVGNMFARAEGEKLRQDSVNLWAKASEAVRKPPVEAPSKTTEPIVAERVETPTVASTPSVEQSQQTPQASPRLSDQQTTPQTEGWKTIVGGKAIDDPTIAPALEANQQAEALRKEATSAERTTQDPFVSAPTSLTNTLSATEQVPQEQNIQPSHNPSEKDLLASIRQATTEASVDKTPPQPLSQEQVVEKLFSDYQTADPAKFEQDIDDKINKGEITIEQLKKLAIKSLENAREQRDQAQVFDNEIKNTKNEVGSILNNESEENKKTILRGESEGRQSLGRANNELADAEQIYKGIEADEKANKPITTQSLKAVISRARGAASNAKTAITNFIKFESSVTNSYISQIQPRVQKVETNVQKVELQVNKFSTNLKTVEDFQTDIPNVKTQLQEVKKIKDTELDKLQKIKDQNISFLTRLEEKRQELAGEGTKREHRKLLDSLKEFENQVKKATERSEKSLNEIATNLQRQNASLLGIINSEKVRLDPTKDIAKLEEYIKNADKRLEETIMKVSNLSESELKIAAKKAKKETQALKEELENNLQEAKKP